MPNTVFMDYDPYSLEHLEQAKKEAFIFDIETTLINKKVSIYQDTPRYILGGWTIHDVVNSVILEGSQKHLLSLVLQQPMLVGHNVSFDLAILGCDPVHSQLVWDTAIFTYMYSGQKERHPTLERSLEYHGLGHLSKESEVAENIKSGVCPSTMEYALLTKYLMTDVEITRELFNAQLLDFYSMTAKLQNLTLQHMFYKTNTAVMSTNGIYINTKEALEESDIIYHDLETTRNILEQQMESVIPSNAKTEISVQSPKQVLIFLNGGEVDVVDRTPCGIYKTGKNKGKPKFKNHPGKMHVFGTLPRRLRAKSTSEKDLKDCLSKLVGRERVFIELLLRFRSLSKDHQTYYSAFLEQVDVHGIIKPQYHHTVTPTGRISCSKPNLMNLPK